MKKSHSNYGKIKQLDKVKKRRRNKLKAWTTLMETWFNQLMKEYSVFLAWNLWMEMKWLRYTFLKAVDIFVAKIVSTYLLKDAILKLFAPLKIATRNLWKQKLET